MRDHAVTTSHSVLRISEGVLLRGGLREPNVTTIAVEVAALQSFGNVLLDNDGASRGIDEVCTCTRLEADDNMVCETYPSSSWR